MTEKGKKEKQQTGQREETIRAFIALALPEHVTGALDRLQQKLKQFGIKMKYTDPENIHLTVKFLGDIRTGQADAIGEKLTQAADGFAPIELSAKGMGVFPGIRKPRVLWTGVGGHTENLEKLHAEVESAMEVLGFEKENRRFSAHLTLGRFKDRADQALLADAIRQFGGFESDSFTADALYLFKSTLTPKGPVYEILSDHPLRGENT